MAVARLSCNMMKVVLICLFLSVSASAKASFSCARAFEILTALFFAPDTFALKQKIMRRFSELGGHRVDRVLQGGDIDLDDYRKGLANLAHALEDADLFWNRIKLDTIILSGDARIVVFDSGIGRLVAGIPYNMPAESILPTLSTSLLKFGIERKLRKLKETKKFLRILDRDENLSEDEYREALEALYEVLNKGPIPVELKKIYGWDKNL